MRGGRLMACFPTRFHQHEQLETNFKRGHFRYG